MIFSAKTHPKRPAVDAPDPIETAGDPILRAQEVVVRARKPVVVNEDEVVRAFEALIHHCCEERGRLSP